jgi:hypothetical protein
MFDAGRLQVIRQYRGTRSLTLNFVLLALLLCLAGFTSACNSVQQTATSAPLTTTPENPSSALSLAPDSASLTSLQQLQFTARVSGTANTAVTWSASAGTISSSGLFTAPTVAGNTTVTITATGSSAAAGSTPVWKNNTDLATTSPRASATVTVTPPASAVPPATLGITTSALPAADVSTPYSASLLASGGAPPYAWSLASGSLPAGIQLQSSGGTISGTTTTSGSYSFTAKVTDSGGHTATAVLDLTVSAGTTSGTFDGPAELPRIYIQTTMANTPAPGSTITVNAGGDLQSVLNSANCGDTISLQAGATFSGTVTFPAKNCNANNWIIVRTSADDSALPPEGTRLTPCYAGVSSLPGRPAFNCANTTNVLAKIVIPGSGTGPLVFADGASYYRLIGLEITRNAGTGIVYYLSSVASGGTASNVILDRVWMHGTAQDDTKKGYELGSMSYASAIDSYFSDFHCVSITGTCTDASAVGGGEGNPVGPFKIVDNFLEASGENILFGGAQSATTPADIQISQNHFFKPLTWLQGQPGYVGGADGNAFIVKNLLELKNAQRILIEGNIMEYSWGGFSQDGYGILITPVNQPGNPGQNLCPICQVTDVTIRYNTISHVGAGLQIANALSAPGEFPVLNGQRYSIHDITIDDVNSVLYDGSGKFAEVMTALPNPVIQNVLINHVTAFALYLLSVSGSTTEQMTNFTLSNSILTVGIYPVWSATGTTGDCGYYDVPLTTFIACFNPYSVTNNAFIGATSSYPPSKWPAGNFFPATPAAVQFVNYNNGNGGNYQLLSASPYHNAATDGTDLGADISTILSETAGVY